MATTRRSLLKAAFAIVPLAATAAVLSKTTPASAVVPDFVPMKTGKLSALDYRPVKKEITERVAGFYGLEPNPPEGVWGTITVEGRRAAPDRGLGYITGGYAALQRGDTRFVVNGGWTWSEIYDGETWHQLEKPLGAPPRPLRCGTDIPSCDVHPETE